MSSPSPSLSTAPAAGLSTAEKPAPVRSEGPGRVAPWRSSVLIILTLLMIVAYQFNPPFTVHPTAGVVMKLPVIVGDFFGKSEGFNEAEHNILPADTEIERRLYTDSHGRQIECSIVLSGAEQRSIHRPEGCLTSQGWTIVRQEEVAIPMPSGRMLTARSLTLTRNDMEVGGQRVPLRSMFIYWFVGEHTTTSSEIHRVLLSNWDRVVHNVAHRWAYVSMYSYITDNLQANGLDEKQTQQMLTGFARQVVPAFEIDEMPASAAK